MTNDAKKYSAVMNDIVEELNRQFELFGDQSDKTCYQWVSILGEEFGELCEAVNETFTDAKHPDRGGYDNIYKEALHVAAVSAKIMILVTRKSIEESVKEFLDAD